MKPQIGLLALMTIFASFNAPWLLTIQGFFMSDTSAQAQTNQDRNAEAWRLFQLGKKQYEQYQFREALETFERVLGLFRAINERKAEGISIGYIGAVYYNLGQYPQALKYYQQALVIHKQVGDKAEEGVTLNNIGHVYNALGQYRQALKFHQQALVIFKQVANRAWEGITLSNIGGAYYNLGQYPQALKYFQQALVIHKQVAVDIKPLLQQNTSLSELSPNPPSFVPTVPNSPTIETPNTPESEQEINTSWSHPGAIILLIIIGSSVLGLAVWSGRFILTKKATQNIKLKQHWLVPSLLILLAASGSGGLIFLMTQSQPIAQKRNFDKNANLAQLISSTHESMGTSRGLGIVPKSEKTNQENRLKQLHSYLIKPIADLLPTNPNERIIFIPQSSLFLVPFPALQDESGKYLIEKHTILTAPSIQVLELTRKQKQRVGTKGLASLQSQDTLIVGNPKMPSVSPQIGEPAQQLPSLPGAEQEAKAIANLLKTKAIIGNQAIKTSVVRKMSNARIVHLATHGLLDERRGLDSAIALTPDPPLPPLIKGGRRQYYLPLSLRGRR